MAQASTRIIDLADLARSRAFAAGFADYRAGLPFRSDNEQRMFPQSAGAGGAWSYERGRQFAALYRGPLRQGRALCPIAYRALSAAMRDRSIL